MLSVNEIQNVTFSKSMNGYKSTEVNVFIDECAKTIESLTREKEDLEKKLEILADRLVEYRDDEDSIRAALLNAQRLGDTTVREANHKASLILEDAQIKSEAIIKSANDKAEYLISEADAYAVRIKDEARNSIISEHDTLEILKKHVSDFKQKMISIYGAHLELIDKIPEVKPPKVEEPIPAEPEEPSEDEVFEAPETEISEAPDEEIDVPDEEIDGSEPSSEPSIQENSGGKLDMDRVRIQTVFTEKTDFNKREHEPSPDAERFKDLKFGEDYDITEDNDEENGGFFRRKNK